MRSISIRGVRIESPKWSMFTTFKFLDKKGNEVHGHFSKGETARMARFLSAAAKEKK